MKNGNCHNSQITQLFKREQETSLVNTAVTKQTPSTGYIVVLNWMEIVITHTNKTILIEPD